MSDATDVLNKLYGEGETCPMCGKNTPMLLEVSRVDHRLSCFSCANKEHERAWKLFTTGSEPESK